MNIVIKRVSPKQPDFQLLVQALDAELKVRDGSEHEFYAAYNQIDPHAKVVVAYVNTLAVACGAWKSYGEECEAEVKRMYTSNDYRGKGIATAILVELEKWAKESGKTTTVLETGIRQPEAIQLYEKCGYQRIPNYGQYKGVLNSVCFSKIL